MKAPHDHEWVEETTLLSPTVNMFCTVCGATHTEPKEGFEQ